MEVITWSNLELNKNEAATQSTLIKYKLGIKDGAPISVEQLKCLKEDSAVCQDHCLWTPGDWHLSSLLFSKQ